MPEIEAPIVGGEFDASDPGGSMASIAKAVAGLVLAGMIVSLATFVWNLIARRTPEQVPEAEVVFA